MSADSRRGSPIVSRNPQVVSVGLPNRLMILLIRLYQIFLSGLLGPACRFSPTCSCYAVEALKQYPIYRAVPLIIYRLVRCNPFSSGGYDPLPAEGSEDMVEAGSP